MTVARVGIGEPSRAVRGGDAGDLSAQGASRAQGDATAGSIAVLGSWVARGLVEVSNDPRRLDTGGKWAVVATFEGEFTLARFASWTKNPVRDHEMGDWRGPDARAWSSSLGRQEFTRRVEQIRQLIASGDVYQANLCRRMSADLPDPAAADPAALWRRVCAANPAPFAGFVRIPGLAMVSASPELFLRRSGDLVESGPIKGTGLHESDLRDKDRAENVMIVDLVRNDLARVCQTGAVSVPRLLKFERHPGMVHLVSTVAGRLRSEASWSDVFAATYPPGSVTGAPKIAALSVIEELEPVERGPYCGMFGWIDADRMAAELAVGIRSFWMENGQLHFGTGAGITWGSDAEAEWAETELKARLLLSVASGGGA
ncbi:MAG: anthranilate synthase component I family protein [Candidatus Nanopelagicales bacterium]|nr:anthranilate synthase component I family protein [Candidatus Nanopelagicales bacterium]MDZ4250451.1 anthranilate synthase component I family protein [Candidatus Nanopelagicales bacterium]